MMFWQRPFASLKVLFLVAALAIPLSTFSAYYDQRPDIFEVEAKDHSSSNNAALTPWFDSARGQMLFLAQSLTFFPKHEYYFLARDIEYTYDLARVLLRGVPAAYKSLHLVPVSTVLSDAEELESYLRQQGVTKKKLGGKPALFLDSCCEGSVPTKISEVFQESESEITIRGFLIQTDQYPNSTLAEKAGADGSDIEDLPHYTQSGTKFQKGKDGKIRVVAAKSADIEKNNSKRILEQIRHDFDNDKARAEFRDIVMNMQILFSYFSKDGLHKNITAKQATEAANILAERHQVSVASFLADMVNLSRKNYARVSSEAEIKKFLEKRPDLANKEELGFAKKTLLAPDRYQELLGDYDGNSEDLTEKILELLIESNLESLGLGQKQFDDLVKKWIEVIQGDLPTFLPNKQTQELFFELAIKHSSPLELAKLVGHLVQDQDYADEMDKTFRRALISAMRADKFRYEKGSVIEFLLNSNDSPLVESEYLYKRVIRYLVESLDQEKLIKVLPMMFISAHELVYNRNEVDEALSTLMKMAQRGIDRIPTINRALVMAYIESPDLPENIKEKSVRRFNRWFFAQKGFFEKDALKISVPKEVVKELFGKKDNFKGSGKGGTVKVEDLVKYYSQSTPSLRCKSVFARD